MDDDTKHKQANESNQSGNEDLSGTMPDLESDDDTLKNAQDMGLYKEADEEHPSEVGIAEEIGKREKEHIKGN